jgi:hypothetical protein
LLSSYEWKKMEREAIRRSFKRGEEALVGVCEDSMMSQWVDR